MDNPNLNPPLENQTPQEPKFPSYEDVRKKSKKEPPHFIVAVIILVLVGVGVIWYYLSSDVEYLPVEVKRPARTQEPSIEQQLESIDVGDLDSEFESIDRDLNNL